MGFIMFNKILNLLHVKFCFVQKSVEPTNVSIQGPELRIALSVVNEPLFLGVSETSR